MQVVFCVEVETRGKQRRNVCVASCGDGYERRKQLQLACGMHERTHIYPNNSS